MTSPIPSWLHALAAIALGGAGLCALVIAGDILAGRRQPMWIMNIVWPVTALWAGPFALWGYFTIGRSSTHRAMEESKKRGGTPPAKRRPFPASVALGSTHCGAGCTLGDLVAESVVILVPLTLAGRRIFGTWALDYVLAFIFGIAFQFFAIAPMRGLSPGRGIVAALKADALSLTSWQLGMYGWMALVVFVWFGEIPKSDPVFWFMMQLAMFAGFLTSYPMNGWLLKKGLKETM